MEWRRSGCTSATASTICSRRDESRAVVCFCWSVVEFLLRGSSGMEMKRSYGFTRRKECRLSLYGRGRKILLSAIDGKFSNVAHERQLPRSLHFARQRSRRPRTAGGQSNCGVTFFFVEVSYKAVCWASRKPKRRKSGPAATTNSFFTHLQNQFWRAALGGDRCGVPKTQRCVYLLWSEWKENIVTPCRAALSLIWPIN